MIGPEHATLLDALTGENARLKADNDWLRREREHRDLTIADVEPILKRLIELIDTLRPAAARTYHP